MNETLSEAWNQRFGVDSENADQALTQFLRHRSVRQFDPERKLSTEKVNHLVSCAQSAATSSNLQLWSVISVENPDVRAKVAELCSNQKQILTAPVFLCFFADHYRLKKAAASVGETCAGLDYMEFFLMAAIDASLAAERLNCAAESMGMGTCYIGALRNNAEGVKQLFNLPDGVFGLFGMCLGYPAAGHGSHIKPRLSTNAVCFIDTYNREAEIGEYNQRMQKFYESEGMSGYVTWAARSGRRADENHLTGRDTLKAWLEKSGFAKR